MPSASRDIYLHWPRKKHELLAWFFFRSQGTDAASVKQKTYLREVHIDFRLIFIVHSSILIEPLNLLSFLIQSIPNSLPPTSLCLPVISILLFLSIHLSLSYPNDILILNLTLLNSSKPFTHPDLSSFFFTLFFFFPPFCLKARGRRTGWLPASRSPVIFICFIPKSNAGCGSNFRRPDDSGACLLCLSLLFWL